MLRTKIDVAQANNRSQITIPVKMRETIKLKEGDNFLVWLEDDKIIMKKLNLEQLKELKQDATP